MARIKFSLGEIIGSIGANTFQRGPFGAIMRFRTTPVNPNTPAQAAARAALGQMSAYWRDTLTQAQRDGWSQYAENTPWTNVFGDPVTLTGRQHFIRMNSVTQQFFAGTQDDAPESPGLPDPPTATIGGSLLAGGITFDAFIAPAVVAAGEFLIIYLSTAPFGPTRNFFRGPYRFLASITSTDIPPVVLKPAAELAVGQRWFYKMAFLKTPVGSPSVGGLSRFAPGGQIDIVA